jgi:hypothetical protein
MPRTVDEQEIVKAALLAFQRTTRITAELAPELEQVGHATGKKMARPDATVRMRRREKAWTFNIEVKPWLNTATVGLIAQKLEPRKKWIVMTRYAQPAVAEQMRAMGVQYMDVAGNAYVDAKDLLVYVKGQKATERRATGILGRPFRPAGMQVIFALICNPGLEQKTYRDIAALTKTAVGTIDWTMQDLRKIGHLIRLGRERRRIVNRDALFDKWVGAYPQQLRPNQLLGRYRAPDPGWWRTAEPGPLHALWGGETAAALETGYLQPEIATLYIGGDPNEVILRFRLNKDPQGNVELYRRFWGFRPTEQREDTVPLPLIYADLMATGVGRNIETAKELRDKKLGRYLR